MATFPVTGQLNTSNMRFIFLQFQLYVLEKQNGPSAWCCDSCHTYYIILNIAWKQKAACAPFFPSSLSLLLLARYVEFKCISRVLTWRGGDEDNLLVVPCSRSDVFTTSAVTLVEKRLLMKFLEFCHEFDHHPEQVEGKAGTTIVGFMTLAANV